MAEKKEVKPVKKAPARRPARPAKAAPAKVTPEKVETPAPVQEHHVKKSLPGIGDLFQSAWQLFRSTFLAYVKVVLVGVGLFLACLVVTILLTLPLMFLTGGSAEQLFNSPSALEIVLTVLLVAWMLVFILGFTAYSIILPIVYLLILDSDKKLSLKELFYKAKPFFWPYLFIGLLTGIAVLGGLAVLIVPGILFSIYFMFVSYVMVFEGLRGSAALKRSYALVKNNFWEIVIRAIILQAIMFACSYVLNLLSEQSDVATFLSIAFSFLTEWFSAAYMFVLYQQIRDHKKITENVSLTWIWVVSIIGLVLIVLLIAGATAGILSDNSLMQGLKDSDKLVDPNTLKSF